MLAPVLPSRSPLCTTQNRCPVGASTTHDPVAAAYASRVLFLSDGLVAGSLDNGNPAQIAAAMSELER